VAAAERGATQNTPRTHKHEQSNIPTHEMAPCRPSFVFFSNRGATVGKLIAPKGARVKENTKAKSESGK
jgi:hypothetical protein